MEINQVVGTLYCTYRVPGLDHCALRVLKDAKGKMLVATDPVGTRPGNWVFTTSGSAARYAMGNADILTDLTIGGIIDDWAPETITKPESSAASNNGDAAGAPAQTNSNPARAA
ncbi:carboxysome peptide B [Thiohalocapsa halophila]|uniref:Carboxysome peptide B n=1 Tax=Thiohalocapsa halophila TaxID=69359 RepID=A0ABS1CM59_9GAMM|nr:carboxysome peptide B [Thiohalocapsa halophila]MBK1632980.1 carboxysome peptide B [Thiohalocapsa halophila]